MLNYKQKEGQKKTPTESRKTKIKKILAADQDEWKRLLCSFCFRIKDTC